MQDEQRLTLPHKRGVVSAGEYIINLGKGCIERYPSY